MTEEELKAKQAEIEASEKALAEREEEAKRKEEELKQREEDAQNIAAQIKAEFEARTASLEKDFEARLKARDEVIKQLSAGDNQDPQAHEPTFIEKINARRAKQNKPW